MDVFKSHKPINTILRVLHIDNEPIASGSVPISQEADFESIADTPILSQPAQTFRHRWGEAFKRILPVYIAMHLALFATSCLAVLFRMPDFQGKGMPLQTLWLSWRHWDSGHFVSIALHGYDQLYRTAFFPLFPILERGLSYFTHGDPFIAGLIISNIALLFLFMVLYQLVLEDFDAERAFSTVLYLAVFPTAFFLAAGYNESLFICFALISFYNMRHGNWWIAGVFGFCAGLTRSVGLLLLLPFCYEYLRQHEFNIKKLRFNILAGILIPAAILLFGVYCYFRFHDFLAFSHAQAMWQRHLHGPWHGIIGSIKAIISSDGLLSFRALRNMLDLGPDLLIGTLLLLSLVGPWRFPRAARSYSVYGIALYLFLQLFPNGGTGFFPLESMSRFMLEIFPAFIVMAGFAKYRMWHLNYLIVSAALLFFLLTQFLTGHWVL
jgi:Mannosyltransferase (PIG-V)